MQTNQEKKGRSVGQRRKSSTRYPKKLPTYVVAFAMKESYDDLKIECRKGISASSSLSPSMKNNVTDNTKTAHRMALEGDSSKTLQEIKINIDDDDSNEVLTSKVCDMKATENLTIELKNKDEQPNKQPQILFDCSKCKRRKSRKRKLKNYKRNIHFKNQSNTLTKKIQRYYSDKYSTVAQIQKDLYEDCITEVVSRYRVVKNALAKENLFEAVNQETDNETNRIDNDSLTSTPSTERTLNNSLTSQKTLRNKSANSRNSDMYNIEPQINSASDDKVTLKTQNTLKHDHSRSENSSDYSKSDDGMSVHTNPSVIEVKSDNLFSYDSNIINVALAVTDMSHRQKVSNDTKEKLHNHSPTSGLTMDTPSTELTSREPSSEIYESSKETLVTTLDMKESSNTTLTLIRNTSMSNDSCNSYALPVMNSTFKENEHNASTFLFLTSDTLPNHGKTLLCSLESGSGTDRTLKDSLKLIRSSQSPTMRSVLSSRRLHKDEKPSTKTTSKNVNKVLVTRDKAAKVVVEKVRSRAKRSKGYLPKKRNCLNVDAKRYYNSHFLNLPNESTLKALLEKEKTIDDLINVPDEYRTEIWEKVTIVLDVITQRLEHSLADKIIKEIRTISNSHHANYESKSFGTNLKEPTKCNENSLHSHKSFQCSIVDNEMLDNMMLKLSMDGPKILVQPKPVKMKKVEEPILYKDIEVLKSPAVKKTLKDLTEEIITVDESLTTTSTLAAGVSRDKRLLHQRLQYALRVPFAFVRENIFVIATIPSFFVLMFLVYTFVAIIVRFL